MAVAETGFAHFWPGLSQFTVARFKSRFRGKCRKPQLLLVQPDLSVNLSECSCSCTSCAVPDLTPLPRRGGNMHPTTQFPFMINIKCL